MGGWTKVCFAGLHQCAAGNFITGNVHSMESCPDKVLKYDSSMGRKGYQLYQCYVCMLEDNMWKQVGLPKFEEEACQEKKNMVWCKSCNLTAHNIIVARPDSKLQNHEPFMGKLVLKLCIIEACKSLWSTASTQVGVQWLHHMYKWLHQSYDLPEPEQRIGVNHDTAVFSLGCNEL